MLHQVDDALPHAMSGTELSSRLSGLGTEGS
jgi:hypothetical protein